LIAHLLNWSSTNTFVKLENNHRDNSKEANSIMDAATAGKPAVAGHPVVRGQHGPSHGRRNFKDTNPLMSFSLVILFGVVK
jgi:hypothetical protein